MTLAANDAALVFAELGAVVFGLAILGRVADRFGFSPIPLYLLAGLCFGEGGIVHIDLTAHFVKLGGEIGVVLLLLALGIEYTADELRHALRTGLAAGMLDLVLNAGAGALAGVALGYDFTGVLVMAGVTYISSSGIVAKVIGDLDRLGNRETPAVLSLLVFEDLVMALYLPALAIVLVGGDVERAAASVGIAVVVLGAILFMAVRHGRLVSRFVDARSNESLLLGVVGLTLLMAGLAEWAHISAAIGAFLVGIALSGPVQERAAPLIEPLRDLFAAMFFLFFGLQIDPANLVDALPAAVALLVVTGATKVATGAYATRRLGIGARGQARAGTVLVARGEFSIVIAGLAASVVSDDLGSIAAAYVLLTATVGPVLTRYADRFVRRSRPDRAQLP